MLKTTKDLVIVRWWRPVSKRTTWPNKKCDVWKTNFYIFLLDVGPRNIEIGL